MSVPTTLAIPHGVDSVVIATSRGDFAAQESRPLGDSRGHVLLIPGFTGSKEDFTPLLPLLSAAGWHATAYDQRGQFETRGTPDDDYSLSGFALDALAVRAESGTQFSHVLGHSFGGLVAQSCVVDAPQAWSSLMLLSTGPAALEAADQVRPLEAAIRMVDEVGLEVLHQAREASNDRPPPADIAAFLRARFVSNSAHSLKAIAGHLINAPDRIDKVAAVGVPIWVGRGTDDDAWPHDIQAVMAKRLGVEIVVIADSAHSPAVENPIATAHAILDFLPD